MRRKKIDNNKRRVDGDLEMKIDESTKISDRNSIKNNKNQQETAKNGVDVDLEMKTDE